MSVFKYQTVCLLHACTLDTRQAYVLVLACMQGSLILTTVVIAYHDRWNMTVLTAPHGHSSPSLGGDMPMTGPFWPHELLKTATATRVNDNTWPTVIICCWEIGHTRPYHAPTLTR